MAFEELYIAYWNKVYRICLAYVNDAAWAQDITQDTFVTVWQQLPNFRNESSIGTWLYRIAANNCLRQIENSKRFPTQELSNQLAAVTEVAADEKVSLLYQYISELPEMDRLIISMELEDVRQADIARILGLTESNVRVRIYRIKEKLSSKFTTNGYK